MSGLIWVLVILILLRQQGSGGLLNGLLGPSQPNSQALLQNALLQQQLQQAQMNPLSSALNSLLSSLAKSNSGSGGSKAPSMGGGTGSLGSPSGQSFQGSIDQSYPVVPVDNVNAPSVIPPPDTSTTPEPDLSLGASTPDLSGLVGGDQSNVVLADPNAGQDLTTGIDPTGYVPFVDPGGDPGLGDISGDTGY